MDDRIEDDRTYFLRRSEQHRALAARSTDDHRRLIHERFADAYARRATSDWVQQD